MLLCHFDVSITDDVTKSRFAGIILMLRIIIAVWHIIV